MASDVSICNQALVRLGADTIASLNDDSNEALLCNRLYPDAKDFILSLQPWNCCINRVLLAETATDPLFYFDHSYQVPHGMLSFWSFDEENITIPYRIEEDQILTDYAPPCYAIVSLEITNINLIAPYIRETISFYLAQLLCTKINSNEQRNANLYEMYNRELTRAKFLDSQQGSPKQLTWINTWNQARFSGQNYNYPNWGYAPPGGY